MKNSKKQKKSKKVLNKERIDKLFRNSEGNQKIKNAKHVEYDNINFKSKTEVMVYKTLKEAGFIPEYEKQKFIIWNGFRPTVPFYDKNKKTRMLDLDMCKLRDTTYTPDFTFLYEGHLIIIEAKGIENDIFPLKKKLFRKLLENYQTPCVYFEVYTKKNTLQAIEIIKNLKNENNK